MHGHLNILDLDPDLLGELSEEESQALAGVAVPTLRLSGSESLDFASLSAGGVFAVIVLEGMVFHHLQIGESPSLRILGPGDVLTMREDLSSDLIIASRWRAGNTTVALLGREVLVAVRRVPRLLVGFHERSSEQIERASTQLAISQLPRVEDRLLAMLWLLAESFGTVTPPGTVLPLSLTHEMLGALVGARRPTVSLALRSLAESGTVIHRDEGWLLIERPPKPAVSRVIADDPQLLQREPSDWLVPAEPGPPPGIDIGLLSDTVERLRLQHLRNLDRTGERLRRTAEAARRSAELRARILHDRAFRSSRPPSS